jgi:membrane-associated protein
VILLEAFHWSQLLQPQFYIENGGLWLLVFVVFAETGLFAGFFLPGDSLLFVAGIYSTDLANEVVKLNNPVAQLLVLFVLISAAGILGNFAGYWFGKKSGPFLYHRKDTFFFKKKYLFQAKEFYDDHGMFAIIIARFLPFIRTFAPIVAGIVQMDFKKFALYNIIGCLAWVFSMLFAGHFLQKWILEQFNFDLKDHLEVIVIGIVAVTTAPVLWKVFFPSKKKAAKNDNV